MRLPKLKGFTSPNTKVYQVVNVSAIEKLFPKGGTISVADLVAAGAVRKGELVKVLGLGDISVKVNVTADKFSGSARDKIVAAGGSVTEI
jgi:large subunit ribosomal protein L15